MDKGVKRRNEGQNEKEPGPGAKSGGDRMKG